MRGEATFNDRLHDDDERNRWCVQQFYSVLGLWRVVSRFLGRSLSSSPWLLLRSGFTGTCVCNVTLMLAACEVCTKQSCSPLHLF